MRKMVDVPLWHSAAGGSDEIAFDREYPEIHPARVGEWFLQGRWETGYFRPEGDDSGVPGNEPPPPSSLQIITIFMMHIAM